eukprot:5485544-Pyramimonas_sp.AAC.1
MSADSCDQRVDLGPPLGSLVAEVDLPSVSRLPDWALDPSSPAGSPRARELHAMVSGDAEFDCGDPRCIHS